MKSDRISLKKDKIVEENRLRSQLVIPLKFHHRETLQKISLDAAVRIMVEAWGACQSKNSPKYCNSTSTVIIPKEQAAKAIRESRFFLD